jgi:hypothetical protein
MTIREFLRANMATIDRVYLDHEAGQVSDMLHCRCGYCCTEAEWLTHVADKIADALTETTVELPDLFGAIQ